MASAARERKDAVHDLAERVQIIVQGLRLLRPAVNGDPDDVHGDPDAVRLLNEIEAAALRCIPLFDRLRKVM